MTEQNHARNKAMTHLVNGTPLPFGAAMELVDQIRDEGRAQAWDTGEARQVAADAQSWHLLRAAVLATVSDPHVWDDGASEAEVLAGWVRRLADNHPVLPVLTPPAVIPIQAVPVNEVSTVTPTEFITEATSAPRRPCGGAAGQPHKPHMYDRAGDQLFCPGVVARIPRQAGENPPEGLAS